LACLHGSDETDAHAARRLDALRMMRQVNTTQSIAFSQTGMYQPLERLSLDAPPEGFELHVVSDGVGYAFSVKDRLDPCRFAYFSDQNGVIYGGQGLR